MSRTKRKYKPRQYRKVEEMVIDLVLPEGREYKFLGKRKKSGNVLELQYEDNEGILHHVEIKMRGKIKFHLLRWDYRYGQTDY